MSTAAVLAVSRQVGVGKESLRRWVAQAEVDAGTRDGVTSVELEEIRRFKAENRRLREDAAILKAAVSSWGNSTPATVDHGFIDVMRAQGHAVESVCRVLREQGCQVAARTYRLRRGSVVLMATTSQARSLTSLRTSPTRRPPDVARYPGCKDALNRISREVRSWRLHHLIGHTIAEVAARINPITHARHASRRAQQARQERPELRHPNLLDGCLTPSLHPRPGTPRTDAPIT